MIPGLGISVCLRHNQKKSQQNKKQPLQEVPLVVQWLKDLALLQLWPRSHLQLGFSLWPRKAHVWGGVRVAAGKKKKKDKFCEENES